MSEELKPCPFCGKIPQIVIEDVEPQGDSWYGSKFETFVKCECGACLFDGSFHEGFNSGYSSASSETIKIATLTWNIRPQEWKQEAKNIKKDSDIKEQKDLLKKALLMYISEGDNVVCQNCLSEEEQLCSGELCESKILTNKINAILKED